MRAVDHRLRVDGLCLRVVETGPGDAPPVLVLHGFTGSAESMEVVARQLPTRRVLRVDLVGHGASDAPLDAAPYAMERCVEQLAGVVERLSPGRPVDVVGYSMGGRAALHLAAARPDLVRAVLVVGASAGIQDPVGRAERVRADRALADSIEQDGLEAFVDRWMALPLFASQRRLGKAALADARRARLAQRPHGLAHSLRGMGTGAQAPLHDRLAAIGCPVCLVAGAEDAKFRDMAVQLAAGLPDGRACSVEKAGHAAHLENPEGFGRLAETFFGEVDRAPFNATGEDTP